MATKRIVDFWWKNVYSAIRASSTGPERRVKSEKEAAKCVCMGSIGEGSLVSLNFGIKVNFIVWWLVVILM